MIIIHLAALRFVMVAHIATASSRLPDMEFNNIKDGSPLVRVMILTGIFPSSGSGYSHQH